MKIFSNNEWSPLKEVIVGNTFETFKLDLDLSFRLFFKDNYSWGFQPGFRKNIQIKKQYIEELNEDIEGLVRALECACVRVHRPKTLEKIVRIQGESWSSEMLPALNVRDQSIIIGDTILETAPCQRCRYNENDLLEDIYKQGEGRWLKMPKSRMLDENFDEEFKKHIHHMSEKERMDFSTDSRLTGNIPPQFEMMIDGANMVRFGKDILINIANRNQFLGYLWIKEHFPDYNFHTMFGVSNNHLDSFIVPLKEGVLLLRHELELPEFLKDWKILYPPEPNPDQFPRYKDEDLILTSPYIDMNVLSIDGYSIITNSLFPELNEMLAKEGFNPVAVQHRHRRIFAGGWHCFTLDLLRES